MQQLQTCWVLYMSNFLSRNQMDIALQSFIFFLFFFFSILELKRPIELHEILYKHAGQTKKEQRRTKRRLVGENDHGKKKQVGGEVNSESLDAPERTARQAEWSDRYNRCISRSESTHLFCFFHGVRLREYFISTPMSKLSGETEKLKKAFSNLILQPRPRDSLPAAAKACTCLPVEIWGRKPD